MENYQHGLSMTPACLTPEGLLPKATPHQGPLARKPVLNKRVRLSPVGVFVDLMLRPNQRGKKKPSEKVK